MNNINLTNAISVSSRQAYQILVNSRGHFFRATFTKKSDGSERDIVCRIGVKKHRAGGDLPYNPATKLHVIVWDAAIGEYRTIPCENLIGFRLDGITYRIW